MLRESLQQSIGCTLRSTIESISGYKGTGLLAETQAFITARGDETAAEAIDALVRGHKELNLWDTARVIYLWDMNDPNKNKWNLRNPLDSNAAHRAVYVGAGLVHANKKITADGNGGAVGSYVRTYFNANAHRRQYRMSIFGYFPDNTAPGAGDYFSWGGAGNSGTLGIDFYFNNRLYLPSGQVLFSDNATGQIITINPMPAFNGLIGHSVKGYQHFKAYRNGAVIGSNLSTKVGYWSQQDPSQPDSDITIFGDRALSAVNFRSSRPLSYWTVLDGVDDTQAAEYHSMFDVYRVARGIP